MPKLPDAQNTPLRREPELVKDAPEGAPRGPKRREFARHFAGYELAAGTLSMVLTCALLALPRASVPLTLPLPHIDRAEARRSIAQERELAARAATSGLPFEVRAVGESIRRIGRSTVRGEDIAHERDDMRTRMKAVAESNTVPQLLELRAVQTEYFLAALRDFARTGKPSAELDELGGDFVALAGKNGWLGARRRFVGDESTLRVLFHLRWVDLIEKRGVFPFSPTLNEWRSYYRFLLEHPPQSGDRGAARGVDAVRLRAAVALGRKDPDYPVDLARGYLSYLLGDNDASASAYRGYLGTHEGGAYAVRARNHLIYALQGVSSE